MAQNEIENIFYIAGNYREPATCHPLVVTDAASSGQSSGGAAADGHSTTIVYCDCCDQPATVTDALGNTSHYRYDARGRKVAEWGTGIQPVVFGHDDAGNMTSLTTFRNPDAVISTDPAEWEGLVHDTTTWAYDPATGLELSKTYADNTCVVKSYDAHNRLATETNARGRVKVHSYEHARGLLLNTTWYHPAEEGGEAVADSYSPSRSFGYNNRSELTTATVNNGAYAYDYDNIGNRAAAVEDSSGVASRTGYVANNLNQYTVLSVDDITDFVPEYDADGNQTRVKSSTGIWAVNYDTENRPIDFYRIDSTGGTTVHCTYDHMGRRATKQVTVGNNVTLHQRYIYRGYLQVACIDLTRAAHPALWYIT